MSVINTMLKDLEQRGGNGASGEEVLRGLSSSADRHHRAAKGVNYYFVTILSVLVVMLVAIILYLVSPYQLVVSSKNESPVVAEEPMQPAISVTQNNISKFETEETALVAVPDSAKVNQPLLQVEVKQAEPVREVVAVEKNALVTKPVQKPVIQSAPAVETLSATEAEEEGDTGREISKTMREPSGEEKSQQAYLEALSMYNRSRLQESRDLLKDALQYNADNLDARKLLASMYLTDNRVATALTVIEKGLTSYPENQELLRLLLQAQVKQENYAEAIVIMEQRLRMTTPEHVAYLAGLYQKNNGHLSAVKLYAQALQLKPTKSVWWMGQGISFEAMNKQEEALKSYQQSIVSGQLSSQLAGYVKNRINTIEQMQTKSAS